MIKVDPKTIVRFCGPVTPYTPTVTVKRVRKIGPPLFRRTGPVMSKIFKAIRGGMTRFTKQEMIQAAGLTYGQATSSLRWMVDTNLLKATVKNDDFNPKLKQVYETYADKTYND